MTIVERCSKGKRQGKQPEPRENGAAWAKTELRPGFADPGLEEGFQYLEGLMNKMSADKAAPPDSSKPDMPFLVRGSKTLLVVSRRLEECRVVILCTFLHLTLLVLHLKSGMNRQENGNFAQEHMRSLLWRIETLGDSP